MSVDVRGQEFEYLFVPNSRYQIISDVEQEVYRNEEFSHNAQFRNIIDAKIDAVAGNAATGGETARVSARYRITAQSEVNSQVYTVDDEVDVSYTINRAGVITVDDEAFLPMVRDVPRWPARELSVGDRWLFVGEEALDLRALGIAKPFKIDIIVQYEYVGMRQSRHDQKSYPAVRISYPLEVTRQVDRRGAGVGLERGRVAESTDVSVFGETNQVLLWDSARGRPHSYYEEYRFGWRADGETIEIRGTAEAYTIELMGEADEQRRAARLEDVLESARVSDVTVAADDEGVVLSVGKLQFAPNSASLLRGEEARIRELARIIDAHNPLQILVIGHTALAGTEEERRQLSELRALAIADLLQRHGVEDVIIQGVGATQPLADNSTERGRRQNRRVEIKLIGEQEEAGDE